MRRKQRVPGSDSRDPHNTAHATPDKRHVAASTVTGASLDALPAHIRDRIVIDAVTGCWRWTGPHDRYGYGRIGREGAHRVVYRILAGEIPAGLVLDHVKARGCRFNDCTNPAHLEPVTVRVNTLRGRSFAAKNYVKDKCGTCGAAYDLLNTYVWRNRRDCRACIRRRVREYKARQRARYASREAFRQAA